MCAKLGHSLIAHGASACGRGVNGFGQLGLGDETDRGAHLCRDLLGLLPKSCLLKHNLASKQ